MDIKLAQWDEHGSYSNNYATGEKDNNNAAYGTCKPLRRVRIR